MKVLTVNNIYNNTFYGIKKNAVSKSAVENTMKDFNLEQFYKNANDYKMKVINKSAYLNTLEQDFNKISKMKDFNLKLTRIERKYINDMRTTLDIVDNKELVPDNYILERIDELMKSKV